MSLDDLINAPEYEFDGRPGMKGKHMFGVVTVGDKGQIVIPRDARKLYDIKPGDALILLGDQKGMALLKTDIFQSVIDQTMEELTK